MKLAQLASRLASQESKSTARHAQASAKPAMASKISAPVAPKSSLLMKQLESA